MFSENILLFGQHINEININLIYFVISTGTFLIFKKFIMSTNVGISITSVLQPIIPHDDVGVAIIRDPLSRHTHR